MSRQFTGNLSLLLPYSPKEHLKMSPGLRDICFTLSDLRFFYCVIQLHNDGALWPPDSPARLDMEIYHHTVLGLALIQLLHTLNLATA